jgi:GntR family transcriptional regulator/MocR family aminotransferase
MVASTDFINEARALRGMMIRHLPPLIQIATAQFIRQGHHDALISKLRRVYKRRSEVASKALKQYFPDMHISHGTGGTNFMITAPAHIDLTELEKYALNLGVVIENISPCFYQPSHGKNKFRLGVSAISSKKIVQGIKRLREAYENLCYE